MIEVFRTNVECPARAAELVSLLSLHFPDHGIHFDLEDADRILCVESETIHDHEIISLLKQQGHHCETLPG